MTFIPNISSSVINTILTRKGKKLLLQNDERFMISKFALAEPDFLWLDYKLKYLMGSDDDIELLTPIKE